MLKLSLLILNFNMIMTFFVNGMMDNDKAIALIDQTFKQALVSLAQGADFEWVDNAQMTVINSKKPDLYFNYMFFVDQISSGACIAAYHEFKRKNFPVRIALAPSAKHLKEALLSQGHEPSVTLTGMIAEANQETASTSNYLAIKRVSTASEFTDFIDIHVMQTSNQSIRRAVYKEIERAIFDMHDIEFYVGYADDKPVTIAMLFFCEQSAFIQTVVTHPDYRRRGYATELIHHLLERSRVKGYSRVCLLATKVAISMCQKLGFKPCADYLLYWCT